MLYRTHIDSVDVGLRTRVGERTMSQTSSVSEDEDMWVVVPLAPAPRIRLKVPESVVQPSRSAANENVCVATGTRSLSVGPSVMSFVRVSAPSSSAPISTRNWVCPPTARPCGMTWKLPAATVQVAMVAAIVDGNGVTIEDEGMRDGRDADDPHVGEVVDADVVDGESDRRRLAIVEERIAVAAGERRCHP